MKVWSLLQNFGFYIQNEQMLSEYCFGRFTFFYEYKLCPCCETEFIACSMLELRERERKTLLLCSRQSFWLMFWQLEWSGPACPVSW